jgi:hypothetical protein
VTKTARKRQKEEQATKRKRTRILWIAIPVILVCLAVGLAVAHGTSPATSPTSNNSSAPADRVDVVYFHRTTRCYSCRWLEAATNYTVNTYFADDLASGRLTFQVINIDEKENADIVKKYGAYGSQLFINSVKDGADHIEHATDLYPLIYNKEAFVTALKNKIEKSLNGET